jgi:hypothetical protein
MNMAASGANVWSTPLLHTPDGVVISSQGQVVVYWTAKVQQPVENAKSVWDRIDELWESVPEEEWDRMPADAAAQHDHYIYGLPKRER